jgi:adenosylcobinamide amidohydrolase
VEFTFLKKKNQFSTTKLREKRRRRRRIVEKHVNSEHVKHEVESMHTERANASGLGNRSVTDSALKDV